MKGQRETNSDIAHDRMKQPVWIHPSGCYPYPPYVSEGQCRCQSFSLLRYASDVSCKCRWSRFWLHYGFLVTSKTFYCKPLLVMRLKINGKTFCREERPFMNYRDISILIYMIVRVNLRGFCSLRASVEILSIHNTLF